MGLCALYVPLVLRAKSFAFKIQTRVRTGPGVYRATGVVRATGKDGKLVLKRLVIEDDEGRERIVLGTWANGQASLAHFDRNEKGRISAGTMASGQSLIFVSDAEGELVATLP